MPSKFTEHFNLNLWDAADKVHHDDFNADNLKLDAALAGKLGQLELIRLTKGGNQNVVGVSINSDLVNWDEWSIVCMLVHYYDMTVNSREIELTIFEQGSKEKVISPLYPPGFMVVFLPMRDASRTMGGLVFSDRFYSFSTDFSYQESLSFWIGRDGASEIKPSIAFFGAR